VARTSLDRRVTRQRVDQRGQFFLDLLGDLGLLISFDFDGLELEPFVRVVSMAHVAADLLFTHEFKAWTTRLKEKLLLRGFILLSIIDVFGFLITQLALSMGSTPIYMRGFHIFVLFWASFLNDFLGILRETLEDEITAFF
jgi:hypothetical protein